MPVVPGTFEPVPVERPDQVDAVLAVAREIGFPLMVKAAAGGGGRGMRRVDSRGRPAGGPCVGRAEAASAFGDGSVYLEREIRPARHVEVQLLGDAAGQVVALGERDCSIQRRHQKLVEESPAPGLTRDQRVRVHELAVRAARAAGLTNAATAEFLLDPDGAFWFLEVNARLQVEHGVTELVSGLDLVREQFWIAAGRPLSDDVVAAAASRSRADAATRSRSGSPPRTPPTTSRRSRGASAAGGCRPGRAFGSTPPSRPASGSRPTTTRSSPRSWSRPRIGRLPSTVCGAPSTRSRSRASRRRCRSTWRWSATLGSPRPTSRRAGWPRNGTARPIGRRLSGSAPWWPAWPRSRAGPRPRPMDGRRRPRPRSKVRRRPRRPDAPRPAERRPAGPPPRAPAAVDRWPG